MGCINCDVPVFCSYESLNHLCMFMMKTGKIFFFLKFITRHLHALSPSPSLTKLVLAEHHPRFLAVCSSWLSLSVITISCDSIVRGFAYDVPWPGAYIRGEHNLRFLPLGAKICNRKPVGCSTSIEHAVVGKLNQNYKMIKHIIWTRFSF